MPKEVDAHVIKCLFLGEQKGNAELQMKGNAELQMKGECSCYQLIEEKQ